MDRTDTNTNINIVKFAITAVIILMLVFSVLLAFVTANSKAADEIRVSDIGLLQKFLNQYKTNFGSYPAAAADRPTGYKDYLSALPADPPPSGCTLPTEYVYQTSNGGSSYQLQFCLGSAVGNFKKGLNLIQSK